MISPVNAIINKSIRKNGEKLKVLTSFCHEGYETSLCKTNCEFYAFFTKGLKRWTHESRPLPQNYHALPDDTIPDIAFDLCLVQTRFGQYQALKPVADALNINTVVLEHTDRMPHWSDNDVLNMKVMRGYRNIFITEYSRNRWMCNEPGFDVIRHGIDDIFSPGNKQRKPHILSVVNDWMGRDVICGFSTWKRVTSGLPVVPVGDSPGVSKGTSSIEELVDRYQTARLFINTSLLSPLPRSLLEAMACGCPIVSTNNSAIPEAVVHGYNGFLSNDERELRSYCELLLKDENLAKEMGENARNTILEKFSEGRFIAQWNEIFKQAAEDNYVRIKN